MSQPPKIAAVRPPNPQFWTGKRHSILAAVTLGALLALPAPGAAEPCRLETLLIVDHVTDLEPGAVRSAFTIDDDRIYAFAHLDCSGADDGERRIVVRWTHEGRLAARKVYLAEPVANYRIYFWAPALPGTWAASLSESAFRDPAVTFQRRDSDVSALSAVVAAWISPAQREARPVVSDPSPEPAPVLSRQLQVIPPMPAAPGAGAAEAVLP